MTGSKKIAIIRNRTNHCSSCQAGLWHLLSSNFPSYTHHPSIEKSHSCSSGLRSCWSKRPCHWIFGRTVLGLWVWAYRCVLIIWVKTQEFTQDVFMVPVWKSNLYSRKLRKEFARIGDSVLLLSSLHVDPLTFPAKACRQDPAYDADGNAVVAPASVKSWDSNLAEPSKRGVSDLEELQAMCVIISCGFAFFIS